MLFLEKFYFIDTGSNSGSFNMTFDESLFDYVLNDEINLPVLRFYSWDIPTLSLGFNQEFNEVSEYPIVRRATGGQAVFHDTELNELTYSLVLKSNLGPKKIYSELAKVFKVFLKCYEMDSELGYLDENYRDSFNCFESKTEADIVVNDIKVIGSAQRIKRKSTQNDKNQCILQHGSIKLDKIRLLSGKEVSYKIASNDLINAFKKQFNSEIYDYSLRRVNAV